MSNQDMINSILSSIQSDEQIIVLMRALISNNLPLVGMLQLQAIMTVLGLSYE